MGPENCQEGKEERRLNLGRARTENGDEGTGQAVLLESHIAVSPQISIQV